MSSFFAALDDLAVECPVKVDRARGSEHPRYAEITYPLDYGYLEGSTTTDGEGVDVFRGTDKGAGVVGAIVTVDLGKQDVEIKVLLDCSGDEVAVVHEFLTGSLHLAAHVVHRREAELTGELGALAGKADGDVASAAGRALIDEGLWEWKPTGESG